MKWNIFLICVIYLDCRTRQNERERGYTYDWLIPVYYQCWSASGESVVRNAFPITNVMMILSIQAHNGSVPKCNKWMFKNVWGPRLLAELLEIYVHIVLSTSLVHFNFNAQSSAVCFVVFVAAVVHALLNRC